MADDDLKKLHIRNALTQHNTRVACTIAELLNRVRELVDEQSPAVIEALIEHWREEHRREKDADAREVQKAILKYTEVALEKARSRERRLFQGITGIEDEPEIA